MTKTAANKAAEEATEKNQGGEEKAATSAPERDDSEGKVTDEGSKVAVWNDNVANQENEKSVNDKKQDANKGFDPDFVRTLPSWQQDDPAGWGYTPPKGE